MKAIILIILISTHCFATNNTTEPKLTFIGKRMINLGVVKEGEIISQKIFFTNSGDSTLVIKNTTKSCNCANVTLKESRTFPKDTNYVSITIDTKGKIGINVVDVILNTNTLQKEHIIKVTMEVEK